MKPYAAIKEHLRNRKRPLLDAGLTQENCVLKEAGRFRQMAEQAWSEKTIYPKNEFAPGDPAGQCGITNFGFGVWLAWTGLVRPERMAFEEGQIWSNEQELQGDNHTWLRLRIASVGFLHDDLDMRIDLTADQFSAVTTYPINMEYPDYVHPASPEGSSLYLRSTNTPLPIYDPANFKGRLEEFMGQFYSSGLYRYQGLGNRAIHGFSQELFWPLSVTQRREDSFMRMATVPSLPLPEPAWRATPVALPVAA